MANASSTTSLTITENSESTEWYSDTEKTVTDAASQVDTIEKPNNDENLKERQPKRKNIISICLSHCRYEVVRNTAKKFGFKEVTDGENWNMYWSDLSITVDRCKEMKRFQKINHFPGMLEICRKDLLARNLNRMLRLFPKDYNFFPKTWCFPADLGEAISYSRLRKHKTFILKPDAGSQGRGIILTRSLKEVRPSERGVCQVYISRPYLIDGYKFDLRVYTLITSCDPLRIYIYNEGLVRFATSRYKEPNSVNISNVFMHLTNYTVNKHSRTYNTDIEGSGSKRKLSWFNNYLRSLKLDVDTLWNRIDDVIIKTIISAYPILKHSYAACFPNHDVIPACCEVLGIDIILDKRLNPHVLEVNHSPSFHTDTQLDSEVKESLLSDMFAMLGLDYCNKRKVIRDDKKRVRERLLRGTNNTKEQQPVNNSLNKCFIDYHKLEMERKGNFRLVFPLSTSNIIYGKYFDQNVGSLYCDTAASRAREAAQNALRDEMQLKVRLEAAKRLLPPAVMKPKPAVEQPVTAIKVPPPARLLENIKNSFQPQMIIESEERERLQRLAQREYLIRSSGIVECAYFLMKKMGSLRPQDEKKFSIFEKIRNAQTKVNQTNKINNKGPTITNLLEDDSNNDGLRGLSTNKVLRPWTNVDKHLLQEFINTDGKNLKNKLK